MNDREWSGVMNGNDRLELTKPGIAGQSVSLSYPKDKATSLQGKIGYINE